MLIRFLYHDPTATSQPTPDRNPAAQFQPPLYQYLPSLPLKRAHDIDPLMLHEEVVRDEDGGDGSQDHPAFRPELMSLQRTRRNFEEAGLSLREEKDHGSPEGKQQDFIRQVDGEKVSLITYRAVK